MNNSTAKLHNPFEGWTTINEAANIIGRDKDVIRFWAAKGHISCYPVGRKVRVVNLAEVQAYAEKNPGYKKRRKRTAGVAT